MKQFKMVDCFFYTIFKGFSIKIIRVTFVTKV